jgi:hypothetical protein
MEILLKDLTHCGNQQTNVKKVGKMLSTLKLELEDVYREPVEDNAQASISLLP